MKKLFLILCLLLTSVFAQEMDTTFVMDSRGEIIPLVHEKGQLPSLSQVLPVSVNVEKNIDDRALAIAEKLIADSIAYYQGLVDKYKTSGEKKVVAGLWMMPFGAVGLVAGVWCLNSLKSQAGGGFAIGAAVIPGGLLLGGGALLVGGVLNYTKGKQHKNLSSEYENQLRLFKERNQIVREFPSKDENQEALSREEIQFARTSPVDVERLDVEKAYAEVLKDGHFKDYRKKSECRAQNSVSDFYKCVEEAYSSGAKTFLALGGLSIGVGVLDFSYRYAKYGRDGENVFRDVLDGAAIVSGVLSLAYGGIYWSMSDKYKEKLGKIQTEGSVANLRMAPYVDLVNGRYGGLLAMNF